MNHKGSIGSVFLKAWPWLFLGLVMMAAMLVYIPGLAGPFFFDDVFSIQNNEHIKIESLNSQDLKLALFSSETGPLGRPVAMLSFALNYYFLGGDASYFKVVNLAIHGVNGLLVFLLSRLLLRLSMTPVNGRGNDVHPDWVALLVCLVWVLHPINLSSVLYVVQRMASLSATFVLVSLLFYVKGRLYWEAEKRARAYILFLLTFISSLAGVFTKENALLLPLYFFLIDWLLIHASVPALRQKKFLRWSVVVWLLLPLLAGGALFAFTQNWTLGYHNRHFTLFERLLTESRALLYYLDLILLPRPGEFGVYHDDFELSTGLFSPLTTFFSIVFLSLLITFAVYIRRKIPLLSFGILFFFAAHAMESTIFPLELIHEHRNYLALFGIVLGAVSVFLYLPFEKLPVTMLIRSVVVLVFCGYIGVITNARAIAWQDINRLTMTELNNHPKSARTNYQAALLYTALGETVSGDAAQEYKQQAIDYFLVSAELNQHEVGGLLAAMLIQGADREARQLDMGSLLLGRERMPYIALVLPKDTIGKSLRLLRDDKPTELALNNLLQLSRCEREKKCRFADGEVDSLYDAIWHNPWLIKDSKRAAVLLDEMALRRLDSGDTDGALRLNRQAMEINPHMAMYKLNGAAILLVAGERNEAELLVKDVLSSNQPVAIKSLAESLLKAIDGDL